jgi:putative SOS response-associated peptidase YedK
MINARAESVAEKPAFRESFKSRRLLVPVSGWFEWTHPEPDPTKKKKDQPRPTPHWLSSPSDEVMLFAGLGATWTDKSSGSKIKTFSIITTDAADSTRAVHDRMPVILEPSQQEIWLDPTTPADALSAMLRPYRGALQHHPVDPAVNDVRADGPQLIERVRAQPDRGQGDLGL